MCKNTNLRKDVCFHNGFHRKFVNLQKAAFVYVRAKFRVPYVAEEMEVKEMNREVCRRQTWSFGAAEIWKESWSLIKMQASQLFAPHSSLRSLFPGSRFSKWSFIGFVPFDRVFC